jgi:hypothetical protein
MTLSLQQEETLALELAEMFFLHFICTTTFNPELGPLKDICNTLTKLDNLEIYVHMFSKFRNFA